MSDIVLGFDFGLARIGVATGQTVTKTATPLTILKAQQGQPDWTQVEQRGVDILYLLDEVGSRLLLS